MVLIHQITKGILTLVFLVAIAAQPGCATKKAGTSFEDLEKKVDHAAALYDERKYRAAESEYRKLVKLQEQIRGGTNTDTLYSRRQLAAVLWMRGKFQESEAEFQTILNVQRSVRGPQALETLQAMFDLADFLAKQGKYSAARSLLKEAVEGSLEGLGPTHWMTKKAQLFYDELTAKR